MPKYLLKGDLSGIQEFIFNTPSKRAAKELRARSLYVQLVQEHGKALVVNKLQENGLKEDNDYEVLYRGGGNFFILLRNPEINVKSFLTIVQDEIDEDLLRSDVYLNLSYQPVEENLGRAWRNLRIQSSLDKQKAFKSSFEKDLFEPFDYHSSGNDYEKPKWFRVNEEIKKQLQQKSEADKPKGESLFGEEINLSNELSRNVPVWDESLKSSYKDLIEELTDEEDPDHQPPQTNDVIDFGYLGGFAESRTGTNKIGVLKMDVDDLGKAFESKETIESLQNLSATLADFFKQKISSVWHSEISSFGQPINLKNNIYEVFAGGDDCFFIGGWDAILGFAKEVNDHFKDSFGKEEKPFTLSGGIVIIDPSFPVIRFANLAEQMLELSKSNGKNNISLFNETFTWQEFDDILTIASQIRDLIENKGESKALIQRIRQSAIGYGSIERKLQQNKLPYPKVWRLNYFLRNAKTQENRKIIDEQIFAKYRDSMVKTFMGKQDSNVMKFPAAARIGEFLTRKK